ncbi:MAG: DUF4292 domain-containing protein, partial [Prolixibacteraceae bacterium]|nr:DUF4292 domain-containing protein [Prolixibacteraceae bacterium]
EGRYVLQSDFNENFVRKEKRYNNIFCYNNLSNYSENIVSQKYLFNAFNFALEKFIIWHKETGWQLESVFDNFTKVDKQDYPGSIDLKMITPEDIIELKIRLSGFSTEKMDDLELRIPAKYTKSRF